MWVNCIGPIAAYDIVSLSAFVQLSPITRSFEGIVLSETRHRRPHASTYYVSIAFVTDSIIKGVHLKYPFQYLCITHEE